MPLEAMIQDWVTVDFCDNCDAPIKEGECIYLDVEHEYAGIIPAYCKKCVLKEAE